MPLNPSLYSSLIQKGKLDNSSWEGIWVYWDFLYCWPQLCLLYVQVLWKSIFCGWIFYSELHLVPWFPCMIFVSYMLLLRDIMVESKGSLLFILTSQVTQLRHWTTLYLIVTIRWTQQGCFPMAIQALPTALALTVTMHVLPLMSMELWPSLMALMDLWFWFSTFT